MTETLQDIIRNPQHHTYVIFGDIAEATLQEVRDEVYLVSFDTALGVEQVRDLRDFSTQATGGSARKILLIAPGITPQAQNALLKSIEEMGQDIFFFICVPRNTQFLDTLLSRVFQFEHTEGVATDTSFVDTFIQSSPADRLKMIDELWALGEGVRHPAILRFLQDFESHLHKQFQMAHNESSAEESSVPEHLKRSMETLHITHDALTGGALSKTTLQLFAFV